MVRKIDCTSKTYHKKLLVTTSFLYFLYCVLSIGCIGQFEFGQWFFAADIGRHSKPRGAAMELSMLSGLLGAVPGVSFTSFYSSMGFIIDRCKAKGKKGMNIPIPKKTS